MKSYTDLEQSKVLADILPLESADMYYEKGSGIGGSDIVQFGNYADMRIAKNLLGIKTIPCWSLAALLKYLSEIKPQIYTPILFPSEGKWILQFMEYGHGNVCEVSCDNPVDAYVTMIEKLHEFNLL